VRHPCAAESRGGRRALFGRLPRHERWFSIHFPGGFAYFLFWSRWDFTIFLICFFFLIHHVFGWWSPMTTVMTDIVQWGWNYQPVSIWCAISDHHKVSVQWVRCRMWQNVTECDMIHVDLCSLFIYNIYILYYIILYIIYIIYIIYIYYILYYIIYINYIYIYIELWSTSRNLKGHLEYSFTIYDSYDSQRVKIFSVWNLELLGCRVSPVVSSFPGRCPI
jgi:hypothetical protein